MGSQNRPTSALANSPWSYNDFNGDNAPLSGLWTVDGIFQNFSLQSFFFLDEFIFANQLGFTTAGVNVVQSIDVNFQTIKSAGSLSTVDAAIIVGVGGVGSWTIFWSGPPQALPVNNTPQNLTASWTLMPLAAIFVKANMANSNFFIGVDFSNWNFDDTLSIDCWNFTINYTDNPVATTPKGSTFRQRGGNRGRLFYGVR